MLFTFYGNTTQITVIQSMCAKYLCCFSKRIMNHFCCCFPGPNHMPMQGPGPGPNQPPNMPSGSMNMPPSSHGSMGGYNHTVPSSQGMPAQSQMNMTQGQPMGNYGPRPNMNMQPNQGKTTLLLVSTCLCPRVVYPVLYHLLHIVFLHLDKTCNTCKGFLPQHES